MTWVFPSSTGEKLQVSPWVGGESSMFRMRLLTAGTGTQETRGLVQMILKFNWMIFGFQPLFSNVFFILENPLNPVEGSGTPNHSKRQGLFSPPKYVLTVDSEAFTPPCRGIVSGKLQLGGKNPCENIGVFSTTTQKTGRGQMTNLWKIGGWIFTGEFLFRKSI